VPQEFWANALFSVTPTILVGLIFWFVLRAIIRADRTERAAFAKVEAQERAKAGLPPKAPAGEKATGSIRSTTGP
jgi:flagellar biosynthesis/type III secretory pathway M-ring protein FliF/YscJ